MRSRDGTRINRHSMTVAKSLPRDPIRQTEESSSAMRPVVTVFLRDSARPDLRTSALCAPYCPAMIRVLDRGGILLRRFTATYVNATIEDVLSKIGADYAQSYSPHGSRRGTTQEVEEMDLSRLS